MKREDPRSCRSFRRGVSRVCATLNSHSPVRCSSYWGCRIKSKRVDSVVGKPIITIISVVESRGSCAELSRFVRTYPFFFSPSSCFFSGRAFFRREIFFAEKSSSSYLCSSLRILPRRKDALHAFFYPTIISYGRIIFHYFDYTYRFFRR